ncbi:hypothetical protein BHM03_00039143 [Ensete ventricosum]|nr:hypothetical protein BHM03_00039143 [Ensete ventricosum]
MGSRAWPSHLQGGGRLQPRLPCKGRSAAAYAFLLRFHSEGSPCKGQPSMGMASPLVGAVGHLQGGGHPQWKQPHGHERLRPAAKSQGPAAHGATARGSRPRPGRRWRLLTTRPQEEAPWIGLPPASVVAGRSVAISRGASRRQQRRRQHRWGQGEG